MSAVQGADALVVATEWPVYGTTAVTQLAGGPNRLVVLDANRFLPGLAVVASPYLQYFAVGTPRLEG
jgi:hypothetical protein